ncbi:MAG: 50S ribosomal protein L30e [Euryarchaeota archaeon]|nr:50S ribosomal protein L30e [Euryarchaeota archaeon]|tara:strand:+ start:11383 stop:11670 length:288 start_codon:yes stop_codon:yes gene_type:complete
MDLNKSLRLAIESGKVSVGANESIKAITSGSAKLVILSSNCLEETAAAAKKGDAPVHSFNGNNSVLGAACGKPFPVSILAILDGGKSDILNLKAN